MFIYILYIWEVFWKREVYDLVSLVQKGYTKLCAQEDRMNYVCKIYVYTLSMLKRCIWVTHQSNSDPLRNVLRWKSARGGPPRSPI